MISGMYLGEVVRLALVKLAQEKMLFGGEVSEALLTPYTFETRYISEIEEYAFVFELCIVIHFTDTLFQLHATYLNV